MNKKELIDYLSEELNKKKSDVSLIVESAFNKITEELVKGNSVRIVGFGAFEVRRRIAREGRNPQTGSKINIHATKTPSFLAGKALKDAVKGRRSPEEIKEDLKAIRRVEKVR